MRILNLYAGLGGNRKLWSGHEVTAIECNDEIAGVYADQFPDDVLLTTDAHQYLLKHFQEFDFVWSSPPCQTHTRMNKATRHKTVRYPSMHLYEEIVLLKHFFKGKWVVENVIPYYGAFMGPTKIGRHLFWSNFDILADDVVRPKNFINNCNVAGKKAMQEWLGIQYEKNIYYGDNHCPAQILRNCVHPLIGKQILDCALKP